MVRIEITDSDGKRTVLTGDRAFGCVMTRLEGKTKCNSYLVGGGVPDDEAVGSIADGVIICAKELSGGNPLLMAVSLEELRISLDKATEEFVTEGGVQNARN